MYQFNRTLRNRRAKILNFSDASFNEILHYIDVHLKEKLVDIAIIHCWSIQPGQWKQPIKSKPIN